MLAEDMESQDVHLNGIVVRDLACAVSNYRCAPPLPGHLLIAGIRVALHVHCSPVQLLVSATLWLQDVFDCTQACAGSARRRAALV